MAKVASFVDVEEWLPKVLDPAVSAPVASRPPVPLPNEFVRVIRTGGRRVTRISEVATVVIEGFAKTETKALKLVRDCAAALTEAEGTTVQGVNLKTVTDISSPGNLPIQSIPRSRYTQTFDLHLKGTTS